MKRPSTSASPPPNGSQELNTQSHRPGLPHGPGTHEGGQDGRAVLVWSVFTECDPNLARPNDPTHAVRDTLEQINVARRFIASNPELESCNHSSCVLTAFRRGGIPSMLGGGRRRETLRRVVDHIMHVVEVAGWDHVGIGGDFDRATDVAGGSNSVADYPALVQAVMKTGATDDLGSRSGSWWARTS